MREEGIFGVTKTRSKHDKVFARISGVAGSGERGEGGGERDRVTERDQKTCVQMTMAVAEKEKGKEAEGGRKKREGETEGERERGGCTEERVSDRVVGGEYRREGSETYQGGYGRGP